jgi:hypothetical protein
LEVMNWIDQNISWKEGNSVGLLRFGIYHIFSLFSIVSNVKHINAYHLPVSRFDELPTSHRHIILNFMFDVTEPILYVLVLVILSHLVPEDAQGKRKHMCLLPTNNFRSKTACIVWAKFEGKQWQLGITHCDEHARRKPLFYAVVLHVYKLRKWWFQWLLLL